MLLSRTRMNPRIALIYQTRAADLKRTGAKMKKARIILV